MLVPYSQYSGGKLQTERLKWAWLVSLPVWMWAYTHFDSTMVWWVGSVGEMVLLLLLLLFAGPVVRWSMPSCRSVELAESLVWFLVGFCWISSQYHLLPDTHLHQQPQPQSSRLAPTSPPDPHCCASVTQDTHQKMVSVFQKKTSNFAHRYRYRRNWFFFVCCSSRPYLTSNRCY
jgi:hypothetical protein